jgi:hypothetical protein
MTKGVAKKLEEVDSYLKCLIAEKEGISPEQVSVRYIHEQREKRIYKTKRYDIGSDYGGYDSSGLTVLTGEQLDEIDDRADKFLSSFA